ncbi:hypothetical protein FBU30_005272 [Linnemannia zychae]|nr:hypothetical protein FBU30_005272 [Linnemannia zychae]
MRSQTEHQPALEIDDIKSQLNAIVAPYGTLFPENSEEAPVSFDLSHSFTFSRTQSSSGHSLHPSSTTTSSSFTSSTAPSKDSSRSVSRQPTPSTTDRINHGIRSTQGSVIESTMEKTSLDSDRRNSLDGISENRDSPKGGSKSGSKLVKSWRKFRQSLKAGTTPSSVHSNGPPTLFGYHSTITEDTRNVSSATSSVCERKTLSDLDRPFEIGSDDILDLGPGFGTLASKFSTGSFKSLIHNDSTSNAKDLYIDLLPPVCLRSIESNEITHSTVGGEAAAFDTKSILSLEKMKQYGKEDWTAQCQSMQSELASTNQNETGTNMNTSGSNVVHPIPVRSTNVAPIFCGNVVTGNTTLTTEKIATTNNDVCSVVNTKKRNGENDYILAAGAVENGQLGIPTVSIIDTNTHQKILHPIDIAVVTESNNTGEKDQLDSGINIEDSPLVVARTNQLGQELASLQRWRLSTRGTPEVVGSICERRVSSVSENEIIQCLTQDTVVPEQDPPKDFEQYDENDRLDNAFRVPLQQSVALASAMFDSGQRIPLVLYYVTEELRARVTKGNVIATIDSLFPADWEKPDEGFEKLVDIYDQRPFGQFFDFSLDPSMEPEKISSSDNAEGQVHPLDAPRMQNDSNETDNNSDTPVQPVDHAKLRVSSRDLSRLILRFLKDLPEPLIPADVFSTFSAMTKLQTLDSVKIQASTLLIQLLPIEQRELLQFLLEFLDEVVLRSLRDETERLEYPDSQPMEQVASPLELGDKHKDILDRMSSTIGVVLSHITKRLPKIGPVEGPQINTSLYRHYKRDFELKAQQEQNARAIRDSAAVFQSLLTFRTAIFGGPSYSFAQENKNENNSESASLRARENVDWGDQSNVNKSVSDLDSDYEYQSDSALYEITSARPIARRKHGNSKSPGSPKRPLTKSRTLHSRHLRQTRRNRRRQAKSEDTNTDGGADNQPRETSNVDELAQAAMQLHMARSQYSQKHIPRPSVATLHSILAEAHSVFDACNTLHPDNATAAVAEDVMTDNAQSNVGDTTRTEFGETHCLDRQESNEGKANGNKEAYDHKANRSHATKPKHEYGFSDFLQEPVDRKQEEREIQLVEKEILQSEITTKYLAANLAGLYPSSSQTIIPPVILPSARSNLIQPLNSSHPGSDHAAAPGVSHSSNEVSISAFNRELTLAPKEQIQLPEDHQASDDCICTFCTTLVQPSQIPVLTRDEYEKAELQSQCDAKDQHIADLLKTVQSLQGEVNILNAKLLFLHDHHTTRPMRRRTLARNSFPVMPLSSGGTVDDWSSRQQQLQQQPLHPHPPQQLSDPGPVKLPPLSTPQTGLVSSLSPLPSAMPVDGNAHQIPYCPIPRTPKLFAAEGIQWPSNNNTHSGRGKARHASLAWDYGRRQDLGTMEEDETMSFLDLEDQQRPLPSSFSTGNSIQRPGRPGFAPREFDNGLRDLEELDEEPEREGEDLLDEFYYTDAYKTMDQQLYRRPYLPISVPPRPVSTDQHKKRSLSKRLSLGQTFRWKGRAAAA